MPSEYTVHIAIELSLSSWVVAVRSPGVEKSRLHHIEGGNTAALLALIAAERLRASARLGQTIDVACCFEAGRDGFWLHRLLTANGIQTFVLEPTSVLVNRRARRAKTDRLDAEGMLRVLSAWLAGDRQVCSMVRVPTPEEEDAKRPHRERELLVQERQRIENRIEALLFTQGIRKRPSLRSWVRDSDELRTGDGRAIPPLMRAHTATPKDEIDRNTYTLFELESGVPTDAYPLEEAVRDKFLVPMQAVSVPLKFQRQGIRYDDLSDEEKEDWDALEWSEEDGPPDSVEAPAINKWLFNADTVDKVLEHLMMRGQHVEGGDRLGKTIIFAKNHAHAEFIQQRFDANYPHFKGSFARVIDFKIDYAQSLIDDFSNLAKAPHIAISVDMLDTGIDVPEIVNLVFFKLVRSKTKFWQMIGRGTRLCPNLFGPGQDKKFFYVFDFCQNLEFFSQPAAAVEGSVADSLSARLFKTRLKLIGALDENKMPEGARSELRGDVVALPQPMNELKCWAFSHSVFVALETSGF